MLQTIFATKLNMGQAWTKSGRRLAVTRLKVEPNAVLSHQPTASEDIKAFQIGYGQKKLKNMPKPLRQQITKSGFSFGVRKIKQVKVDNNSELEVGKTVDLNQVFQIGDMVKVQGKSKGRGFAGVIKRHGFAGGPKTHGQSDRHRAPGSIGQGTTPGRVHKGKRMAGRMGNTNFTVSGLQVIYINPDTQELWVSGPVPGHINGIVQLTLEKNSEFEGLDKSVFPEMVKAEAKAEEPAETEIKEEELTEEKIEQTKEDKSAENEKDSDNKE